MCSAQIKETGYNTIVSCLQVLRLEVSSIVIYVTACECITMVQATLLSVSTESYVLVIKFDESS